MAGASGPRVASDVAAFRALAESGPLFGSLASRGAIGWEAWAHAAHALEARLPADPLRERRIHHLYVPTLLWILGECVRGPRRPVVVGLSAPQGSGKTTLVRELLPLLSDAGVQVAAVSIDDFYLPREEQVRLAQEHSGNRILEHRGAPGTHDVALGEATLERLRHLGPGETMGVPRYDKTLHGGRGDRSPVANWPKVTGPLDLVMLEGWCVAFRPVSGVALANPALEPVNAYLARYVRWQRQIDALLVWSAKELEQIVGWRVEAEERSRAEGRPGLDRASIEDYIRRFLPVYAAYARTATLEPPARERQLEVVLSAERLPI